MRKILLGTTAVVGAALLGATAAQAQTAPTVRVGGFMVTQMTYNQDDLDRAAGIPSGVAGAGQVARERTDFKNEVEIQIFVNGKAANGLAYGAVIEVQNDGTGGTIFDIDEAYTFVSSPTLGTIRFGEEDSAASLLQVRHPSVATSGTDGDWGSSLLSSSAFTGGGPALMTGVNDGNDSTKIIYLSPQFFGFDVGFSYSPNRNEGDRVIGGRALDSVSVTAGSALLPTAVQRDGTGLSNELSAGLRYRGSFNNIGIAASFVAQRADAPSVNGGAVTVSSTGVLGGGGSPVANKQRDMTVYAVGLSVSAFGFTVGGEYAWGNYSGNVGTGTIAQGVSGSSSLALGATYTMGAWAFGGFYGIAEQDTNVTGPDREQTVWGISGVYTLAPGLDLYATYAQMKDENVNIRLTAGTAPNTRTGTLRDRDASVFLIGSRLAF